MFRSSFHGIETARRSLFAQQTALYTTGHNIANANTKGYTRQIVNLTASRPIEAVGLMRSNAPGQLGTGVEFDYIKRVREDFLDQQFYNENSSLGAWTVRKDTLEKIEAIINEPSENGIRQTIEGFWNAWQELSKNPENITSRILVKERALAMTDALNHTSQKLSEMDRDLTENIKVQAAQADTMLRQIAQLNREIFRVEGLGNNPNDLKDQRDLLVDNLSEIMNVTIDRNAEGYTLSMGDEVLVDGVEKEADVDSAWLEEQFQDGNLIAGEVHGMIYSRDVHVGNYTDQLDAMVQALVQGEVEVTLPEGMVIPDGMTVGGETYSGSVEDRTLTEDTTVTLNGINGVHELGYIFGDAEKRVPFFSQKAGHTEWTADSLTVNPEIVDYVLNISSSSRVVEEAAVDENGDPTTVETVVRGNNDIALLISDLRTGSFSFPQDSSSAQPVLDEGSFDEFFRSMIGELGIQTEEATRQANNQSILKEQVDSRRMAVSGVSLDEEMANMIKYQHAYNAAARSMTMCDEVLDKVINGMGIVGR